MIERTPRQIGRRLIARGQDDLVGRQGHASGRHHDGSPIRRYDVERLGFKPVDADLLAVGQGAGVPQKQALQIVAVNAARHELLT